MAARAPYFATQFFTDAGLVAAGYSLHTYESGTTTPKATYSDQAGTTPNANPIILDSAGRCSLWLGTGEYTLVLRDTLGATVETWDDVAGIPSAATATYLPLNGSEDMTGPLILAGNATANLGAVPLQQLNSAIAASTKAATSVSVADAGGYFAGANAEAVLQELGSVRIPELSGNSGKVLTTNGTALSWTAAASSYSLSATDGASATRTVLLSAGTWQISLMTTAFYDDSAGNHNITVTQDGTVGTTTVSCSFVLNRSGGAGYGRNVYGTDIAVGSLVLASDTSVAMTIVAANLNGATAKGSVLRAERIA